MASEKTETKLNRSLPLLAPGVVLGLASAAILGLLCTVLYMPDPDSMFDLSNGTGTADAMNLFLAGLGVANDQLWFGANSMELARALKERSRLVKDSHPLEAVNNLQQALEIEREFQRDNSPDESQSFLETYDAMEIADTEDRLLAIFQKTRQEAPALMAGADLYLQIKNYKLHDLYLLAEDYLALLKKIGETGQASQAQVLNFMQQQLAIPDVVASITRPDKPLLNETSEQYDKREQDKVIARENAIQAEMSPDPQHPEKGTWGKTSQDAMQDYLKLVQAQISAWKKNDEKEFQLYVAGRKYVFEKATANADALSYLADYNRITGGDLALEDRVQPALEYYERCAKISDKLPNSSSQSSDRAELALAYLQLEKYDKARENYESCVNLINGSANPDIVLVLPQFQGSADLFRLMHKDKDAQEAASRSSEICDFLNQLKEKHGILPPGRPWQKGDLVQAYWDERWWSSRVVQAAGERVRVHFIGLDDSQDDWFVSSQIRQHPPYGFAALQAEVPECAWALPVVSH